MSPALCPVSLWGMKTAVGMDEEQKQVHRVLGTLHHTKVAAQAVTLLSTNRETQL